MLVCVGILLLKPPGRREGARPVGSASADSLAIGCCSRIELAHARIDPLFRSGTAHDGPRHYDSVSGRGTPTSRQIGPSFGGSSASPQIATRGNVAVRGCTGHFGSPCATLGAERVQGLLSRERRSLVEPHARARQPPDPQTGPRLTRSPPGVPCPRAEGTAFGFALLSAKVTLPYTIGILRYVP